MNRKYSIRTKVEFGEFDAEGLKRDGAAGSDELLVCSVVRFSDGRGSIAWHSTNGHGNGNEEISPRNLYSLWVSLAQKLIATEGITNLQREVLTNVIDQSKTKSEKIS